MAKDLVSQAADRLTLARQDVQLHASDPGLAVATRYTAAVDETLLLLWNAVAKSTSPGQRPFKRAALVAQGGYGREELNLHSDIDVLVIIPDKMEDYEERGVQQFFHLLWDLHLDVGRVLFAQVLYPEHHGDAVRSAAGGHLHVGSFHVQ